jgi:uncharacterized membrane protein (UPF0127 family)
VTRGIAVRRATPYLFALAAFATALSGPFLAGCKRDGQQPQATTATTPAPTAAIDTGTRKLVFHLEVAVTPEEQQRGLMYRDHLATDAGMLFVSARPSMHTFWMKNTLIPLDMIFIGADRKIVGIVENAKPQTLTERRVDGLSQYVLEIGGGLAAQLGIRAGQSVELQSIPPAVF